MCHVFSFCSQNANLLYSSVRRIRGSSRISPLMRLFRPRNPAHATVDFRIPTVFSIFCCVQGQVREVTQGSHDITANRDMRDALGKEG